MEWRARKVWLQDNQNMLAMTNGKGGGWTEELRYMSNKILNLSTKLFMYTFDYMVSGTNFIFG